MSTITIPAATAALMPGFQYPKHWNVLGRLISIVGSPARAGGGFIIPVKFVKSCGLVRQIGDGKNVTYQEVRSPDDRINWHIQNSQIVPEIVQQEDPSILAVRTFDTEAGPGDEDCLAPYVHHLFGVLGERNGRADIVGVNFN